MLARTPTAPSSGPAPTWPSSSTGAATSRHRQAPDAVARESADPFVAPELVSLLTQPRGARSEYHMRRERWLTLLSDAMGPEIRPLGTRTLLATPHADLFAMHFGRLG